jgi:3-oxoadipate enol-lactonase
MDGIVLLHAFPYSPAMWKPQLELLSRHSVMVPNLLGFEGFDEAARSVLKEVDLAGWQDVLFVGLSMGGYTIFRLWEKAPERFAGMVLACTRAIPDSQEAKQARKKQAERLACEGVNWLPDALFPTHFSETTLETRAEVLEEARTMILSNQAEPIINTLTALANRLDSRPLLPNITVPTLVLAGEEDKVVLFAETKEMAQMIPNARLERIPKAGHLANIENPKAFNNVLETFINRLEAKEV